MATTFSTPESRKHSIDTRLGAFISAGIVLVGLLASSFPVVAQELRAPKLEAKRTDLQRHDLSAPGREVIQVRVDFPPGLESPKHSHPGEEIVYTIEGQLEYRLEGKPPVTLKTGEVLFIPAGASHVVKNVGSGNAAELATYVVEKGKPLIVLDK